MSVIRFLLKLALVVVNIAVAALVAEFLTRILVLGGPVAAAKSVLALVPLSRTGLDLSIVPDPELGFRYNPNLPNVNSHGIRSPELRLTKQPGQLRVIVLGDSVSVFTDRSEDPELNYAGILGRHLGKDAEVINAAIAGYTTHQQRLLFERELARYCPEIVILQYTLNDHTRYSGRWHGNGLVMTEEAKKAFLSEDDPFSWLPDGSYLALRFRMYYRLIRGPEGRYPWDARPGWNLAWQDDSWPPFEEELRRIKQLTEQGGGRLMVMMVPFGEQFDEKLLAAERDVVLIPQQKMAGVCHSVGVPLLDLTPTFEKAGGADNFYDMVHLKTAAQRIVARELIRKLHELGWILRG